MSVTLESLTRREHRTTAWSGGTTTELAIYPVTASYQQGNYLWRLSTATVDVEASLFSALPGIARTLMVLDGQISLRHEGHHERRLQPFDQDHFDGGWTTHSHGQGTDFNLMCASGLEGELSALVVAARDRRCESFPLPRASGSSWLALYCVDGELTLSSAGERAQLASGEILVGDAFLLSGKGEWILENSAAQPSVLIRSMIRRVDKSPNGSRS